MIGRNVINGGIRGGRTPRMQITSDGIRWWYDSPIQLAGKLPEKYIINDGATVLFWSDDTKTISKRHKEDTFDKELGFLFAYYYKKCGLTNAARKRVIDSIDYSKIKTFLFEMFVKESGYTVDKARKYLKGLEVSK